jgi:hypothetical protein
MLSQKWNVILNRRAIVSSKVEIIENIAGKDAILLCTVSDRIDA